MLNLGYDLYGNRSNLHTWILLADHSVYNVQYLIAEACLADSSSACSNHEWPEDWRSYQANGADCCFVKPFLLSYHGDCAASGML